MPEDVACEKRFAVFVVTLQQDGGIGVTRRPRVVQQFGAVALEDLVEMRLEPV
jgi:hypothetical protein